MSDKIYVVFDVESVGLHGEGFQVGAVVVDEFGQELSNCFFACPPKMAQGTAEGLKWVNENVPKLCTIHETPKQVRNDFWRFWMGWKEQGALLVADCAWPVEARFLRDCVLDKSEEREWQGPYPLIDLSAILLAKGDDPLSKFDRLPSELPEHNPVKDARQSARIFTFSLNYIRDILGAHGNKKTQ